MGSLVKNSLFNVAYQLIAILFPLITSMYVSRVLTPDGLGSVMYADNIASYFVLFAPLGIAAYGVREISKARDDRKLTNTIFSELFVINALSTLLFSCLYALFLWAICDYSQSWWLQAIYGSLVMFNLINVDWFYQGREDYVYISTRSAVVKVLLLACVFLFVKTENDVLVYAALLCAATVGNYIFNIVHIRRFARLSLKGIDLKRHLKPIFILAGTVVLFGIYARINTTMLGLISGDSSVAVYTNAYKIANVALTVCTAVAAVFLPRLSLLFEKDRRAFSELLAKAFKLNIMLSIPIAVGLALLSEDMMSILFGQRYSSGNVTLMIFSLLLVGKCVGNVIYQAAISTQSEKKQLIAYSIAVMASVPMNYCLIPVFGSAGAAATTLVTELIVDVALMIQLKSIMGVRIERRFYVSVLVSVCCVAASVVVCALFFNGIVLVVSSVVFGALSYGLMLYLTKNDMVELIGAFVKKVLR